MDNSFYSEKINNQNRSGICEQEYVIKGYLRRLKDESVKKQLKELGYDYNDFVGDGMYAIKIVEDDKFSIIFGFSVVILAVGCLIVNFVVKKKNV